uniref:PiggyBac transposable element-derived protein 3 n=1 Tax=Sipha flava TaxID=143950 RepID=A0A2S2R505_9HEMI
MEKIKSRCIENFIPIQNINYNELMIKYFGRHSCKQFIRGKPIRFGYKMWCLNSADSYLINFDIYQGKLPNGKPNYENIFGKCTAPLIYFLENLLLEKRKLPFRVFCDNLFTSSNLLSFLRGYSGTGTIRDNRLGKDFPLIG